MFTNREPTKTTCARCSGCPIEVCPVETGQSGRTLDGWRLALCSMGMFLGPVVLAIAGAAAFGESAAARFAGAVVGLCTGLIASALVGRLVSRSQREEPQS